MPEKYTIFFRRFRVIKVFLFALIISSFSSSCGGGGSGSVNPDSSFSGYESKVESAFFELPSSITGTETTAAKNISGINANRASSQPGGIIDVNFPSSILHKFMRVIIGSQRDLIDVYKEISIKSIKDIRIFAKPGTPFESEIKFSFDSESFTAAITAYDDTANGYMWKVVMAEAETPDDPFMIFRFTVNDEIVKGKIITPDEQTVIFIDGDSTDTYTAEYSSVIEICFEKTAGKSILQFKQIPDMATVGSIITFLNTTGSKYISSVNDKMKKNVAGEDDNPTDKGEGPGFSEITFTKDSQYCTMAAMFYFPLLKEFPILYYKPDKPAGEEICSWTFRGKAIIESNRSRVDMAYPLSDSASIDWSAEGTQTVFKRQEYPNSGWYPYVTNSALFEGSNYFIGFWDGINFSGYDISVLPYKLKTPVTGAPASIQDLAALTLDDIEVTPTKTLKDMVLKFE